MTEPASTRQPGPALAAAGYLPPPEAPGRPRSATGLLTGAVGLAAAIAAMLLFRTWLQPVWLKTLAVLGATALAMLAVELAVYRVHLNPSTGLSPSALRRLDPLRIGQKLFALWGTIGVIAFAYWLFPSYAGDYFAPFWNAALWCLPVVLVLSPFYVAYIDCRQRDPVDAYAQLTMLIGGQRPADWNALGIYARGWLVKAFFLPLMFAYVNNDLATQWGAPMLPPLDDFGAIFSRLIDLFYLLDVLIAAIAYAVTFRIIDTHIRSVEPTIGGWVICILCYPPFWGGVGTRYFTYDQDRLYWGQIFAGVPWLYVAWGSVILALVFIYAWSTAAFGMRFSNLTNRGIITNGPYRWVKHPAYLSKNLSWWMISMPFIAGAGWDMALRSCLLLGGVNLIYFLRARTEERHLSQDPAYRDYKAFIARRGLFARLGRPPRAAA